MIEVGAIYAAFDVYPSYKGASTHIQHMIEALAVTFEEVTVYTLGRNEPDNSRNVQGVVYQTYNAVETNYLKRTDRFMAWLSTEIRKKSIIELAHFRDVWSALAILDHPGVIHSVYEVNAFLPVELPYRYPGISENTLERIDHLERQCMADCDRIITPSAILKNNLVNRGIPENKINVVTNGADVPRNYTKPEGISLPDQYIIYFGALQPWQGIDQLIKAMVYLSDYQDLKLVICSSHKSRYARSLQKLADKLGVGDRIEWFFMLGKSDLNYLVHNALVSVAPLTECTRNLEQGCSPIKIFESMANRTAVLATDLPVTREIITDNVNGKLVRADRPAELARGIRLLLDYPDLREKLARNGEKIFMERYRWDEIIKTIAGFYQNILVN